MATLTAGNFALEVRYLEYDEEHWIHYEVLFLYKNLPIINDSVLKRTRGRWRERSPGAFKANEVEEDRLISTIQRALDDDEDVYYQPTDPDFTLAIYPNQVFPFMPSNLVEIYTSDRVRQAREERAMLREVAGGRLPDDPFTLILMVDRLNFGDEFAYSGEGPALILKPCRHELRQFMEDLRAEYGAFCEQWGVGQEPE